MGRAAAPPSGSAIITQEEILASGATTAWEAIKRGAPFLSLRERSSGEPARMWRRGRGSFYLDDAPTVVLDGVRQPDFRSLHLIPAHTILVIYIFTGIDGTTYYGTGAAGGVIEIRTKDGGAR